MNKDLIYISSAEQEVAADANIVLPIILRRKGCAIESFGAGALLKKAGYYKVSGIVTFTTPTAGQVDIQIRKANADVTGIASSVTTSSTSNVYSLNYSGVVRVYCGEQNAVITLTNAGVAIDVTNAKMEIEYE